MPKSVDDLVASLPPAHHGYKCWGSRLDKRGKEFIEALRAREATGVKILRSAIQDTLQSEFGVTVGPEALKNHLAGRCTCE